jgi:hypothetical protein
MEIIENRATGYVRVDGKLQKAPFVDMSNRLRWRLRHHGGRSDRIYERIDEWQTYQALNADRNANAPEIAERVSQLLRFWLGFIRRRTRRGGSTPGFSEMIYMNRQNGISVAILTNLEDAPERTETALRIARDMLGPESTPRPSASKSP